MATIDLCSVADVKAELEITNDTTRDTLIGNVITSISRTISTMFEREFRTETSGSTTRHFQVTDGDYVINLAPYDLSDSTNLTVTLHPGTASQYSLIANTEFLVQPTEKVWTYQTIRVSPWVAQMHVGDTPRRFGVTLVDVTSASWGFASVPEDVKRAAIISVAANIDRRLDAFNMSHHDLLDGNAGIGAQRSPAYSIPTSALVLLNPYRRFVGAA